jgi:hypothetical protein
LGVFNWLEELGTRLDGMEKPDGSRLFPAKSCKDLKMCFPDSVTGEYWIDTNGGTKEDAFLARCNFDDYSVQTCIQPKKTSYEKVSYEKVKSGYKWILQEIHSERDKFEYTASKTQMEFLRMSSDRVRQNITYNCLNSNAHLKIMTNDETEIKPHSDYVNVISDECHKKDGTWRQAVLEVETTVCDRLPVADVAVKDIYDDNQEFGIDIGPICFE